MKKRQVGNDKFKGKLPFKCFAYERVHHYVTKCPYKENHEKVKQVPKKNAKINFDSNKKLYTHEYTEYSSNNEDDRSYQHCQLLMEFEECRF